MDTEAYKQTVVTNVYHITAESKVPLHKHRDKDEIFHCVKGSGFSVLKDSEQPLNVGETFVVPHQTMHSLRTDGDLYVVSIVIPVVK